MVRFCSLASGSKGNATIVESEGFRILVDCGISYRELQKRLRAIELAPKDIDAVFISHFHSDHISGLRSLAEKEEVEIFAPEGFQWLPLHLDWTQADPYEEITVGPFCVYPIKLPHDDGGTFGFQFRGRHQTFIYATDFGSPTEELRDILRDADAIMIEANHDLEMLKNCAYPEFLKRRISCDAGHLSNCQCQKLLVETLSARCQHLTLAHLSEQANLPELAKKTVGSDLSIEVTIAGQYEPSGWRSCQMERVIIKSAAELLSEKV